MVGPCTCLLESRYTEIKDFIESERSITQEMIDDLERELEAASTKANALDASCRSKDAEHEAATAELREQLAVTQGQVAAAQAELISCTAELQQSASKGSTDSERLCDELVEQELLVCDLQQKVEDLEKEVSNHAVSGKPSPPHTHNGVVLRDRSSMSWSATVKEHVPAPVLCLPMPNPNPLPPAACSLLTLLRTRASGLSWVLLELCEPCSIFFQEATVEYVKRGKELKNIKEYVAEYKKRSVQKVGQGLRTRWPSCIASGAPLRQC